ncbi:bifunctional phosphoribosyl-AMP cyclohydrolase/phosphoribosyl-ATP diphosphatase HisIE [Candidatus Gracilibacteria bacterium]|nr:bifunctional phosphoribosyl-AMP cyclohydrolase/phosphoribosyl-ATP diphosphatase HisIE [Candidatus Gracilibacteria bacterium]
MKIDFKKMDNLIPVIAQDNISKRVLMLGYMNNEAYEKTLADGFVTFWSRSKGRLWQKGETSGNKLKVVSMNMDCDGDTLLVMARPLGPTCHTGETSCFGNGFGVGDLFKLLEDRKDKMPKGSYTSSLFEGGLKAILAKVEEESEEVVRAARSEGKQRLMEESCDLFYHMFVLLINEDIDLGDIEEELSGRNG